MTELPNTEHLAALLRAAKVPDDIPLGALCEAVTNGTIGLIRAMHPIAIEAALVNRAVYDLDAAARCDGYARTTLIDRARAFQYVTRLPLDAFQTLHAFATSPEVDPSSTTE